MTQAKFTDLARRGAAAGIMPLAQDAADRPYPGAELTVFILEAFAPIPQDLSEAARIDGCTDLEIFLRIVLPVGMPAIVTTVILNFVHLWSEYLFAVALVSDEDLRTLPAGIRRFMATTSRTSA
jgi:ABC-type glycerol-3-phosphate transport system permease component